jgi:hypothetical protein
MNCILGLNTPKYANGIKLLLLKNIDPMLFKTFDQEEVS